MKEQIEKLLEDFAARRAWGVIEIQLKNGRPILLRHTIQTLIEETTPGDKPRK